MSMVYPDDKNTNLIIGKAITDDAADVFADAIRWVPVSDTSERAYINVLLDRVRCGELGIYTLSAGCKTVGVICHRALDGDVELVFGHLLGETRDVAYFLEAAVQDLFNGGAHTVRSNFTWPEPHEFIKAATSLGFTMTERMSMGLAPSTTGQKRGNFELFPWHDRYAPEVCRIMCEDSSPADRHVYPMFSRPDGARMLMDSVLNDRHGQLLRDLCCVARSGDHTIGFLLSTMLPDGSVLVLNIAVERGHRRMGVGGAMLDRLSEDSYLKGYRQILLAVTSNNYEAIRLYERKGFKVNGFFRQYVLSKIK